jgi:hypothetical protein
MLTIINQNFSAKHLALYGCLIRARVHRPGCLINHLFGPHSSSTPRVQALYCATQALGSSFQTRRDHPGSGLHAPSHAITRARHFVDYCVRPQFTQLPSAAVSLLVVIPLYEQLLCAISYRPYSRLHSNNWASR